MTQIVWFRQDLRLADNPALLEAAARGPVVPVFIWAPREEGEFPPGGAAKWWLGRSLARLDEALRARGSRLILRAGESLAVLRELVKETGATGVHWNRRYEPYAIERDRAVKAALRAEGLAAESHNASLLFEPWTVANKAGKPFQVFTPFYRHCLAMEHPPEPLTAPELVGPSSWPSSVELASLELEPVLPWASGFEGTPGEAGAQAEFARMLSGPVSAYATERDFPAVRGTSRLSPHLHFGEIGPRQIWHGTRVAAEPWLRQLVWREFAHHLLFHFPHTARKPLRVEFERFDWRNDPAQLRAWQQGRTGYPIVDAGMRELWTTGWMHNRVRMIVGSFLVKHLRLHWEEGAFWFWDTLVDADLANNTLGWQWTAGCGADAAPYFRVFNPILQGEKFDPAGAYVRRWVPELAKVPAKFIHRPWEAGMALDYPAPIVDHAEAREAALKAFAELRAGS